MRLQVSAIVSFLTVCVSANYSSSTTPVKYAHDQIVPVQVNVLTSELTGMSFDFYDESFKFCQPKEIVQQHESLGAVLFGDRIKNSPIQVIK